MDTAASLDDIFEQIQVLKDEHSKVLQLIEKERNARREAILETEQAKKAMAESNAYLEGLLRTQLLLGKKKKSYKGKYYTQSFVDGMHSLYHSSVCAKYFQQGFLQCFHGELDQQNKEMEQEIEILRKNASQIKMAIEAKRERQRQLSHLEGMREELLRNINELEGADKAHTENLARMRNELVSASQQGLPESLLNDLKEAKEQCLYWKDLLTSLEMQCASQQKKVNEISAKVKAVESESEKFAEAQSKRNRSLPPTWRTRKAVGNESLNKSSYQTASEMLQITSKSPKSTPRGFNPIFLDEANEVEKEADDNDGILTKLW